MNHAPQGAYVRRQQQAAKAADELILFADGATDAGIQPALAARARNVARELIWALQQLEAEQSTRKAIQARYDVCLHEILNPRAAA